MCQACAGRWRCMLTVHRRHRLLQGQNEQRRVGAASAPEGEVDRQAGAPGMRARCGVGWSGQDGHRHTSSQQSREGLSSPSLPP